MRIYCKAYAPYLTSQYTFFVCVFQIEVKLIVGALPHRVYSFMSVM